LNQWRGEQRNKGRAGKLCRRQQQHCSTIGIDFDQESGKRRLGKLPKKAITDGEGID